MPKLIRKSVPPIEILSVPESIAGAISEGGYIKPNTTDFPLGFPRGLTVVESQVGANNEKFYAPYIENSVTVFNAESAFDEQVVAGVTNSVSTDAVSGTASAQISVDDSVSAGTVLASKAITATDLSAKSKLFFYIKTSKPIASGDLQILLDDMANLASPNNTINIPNIKTDTWTRVELDITGASAATISVGIKQVTDLGVIDIQIDDIRAFAISTLPAKAVLKDSINWEEDQLNVNGEEGYQIAVYTHGTFFKNRLTGLDADALNDLQAKETANGSEIRF